VGGYLEPNRPRSVSTVYDLFITRSWNLKPPAVLQICQESRSEALKFYSVMFEVSEECRSKRYTYPGCPREPNRGPIYLNPETDRICPQHWNGLFDAMFDRLGYRGIQKIAVELAWIDAERRMPFVEGECNLWVTWLKGIKEIVIFDEELLRKAKDPYDFEFVESTRPRRRMREAGDVLEQWFDEIEDWFDEREKAINSGSEAGNINGNETAIFIRPLVRLMRPVYRRDSES
jgi:hypothetical protein